MTFYLICSQIDSTLSAVQRHVNPVQNMDTMNAV